MTRVYLPGLMFLGVLSAWSCQRGDVGEQRPTQEEIEIWTEALLIESALQDFNGPLKDSLAVRYYDQLYDRYGLDEAALDALRDRYGEHLSLWEAATDSMIARIERNRTSLDTLINPGLN